jgi:polyisoprenoid-binding protein YceI
MKPGFLVAVALAGAAIAAPIVLHTAAPLSAAAPAAMVTFVVDQAHTMVQFKVRHLGLSTVTGRFGKFEGTFQLDPASGQVGAASLSIDAASITTDNERRDGDLKSANFFAVDSFPKLTFVSTSVQKLAGTKYKVTGNLTIRGVTKAITLDGDLAGTRQRADKGYLAALSLTGTINRKDFGLVWNRMMEGVAIVADDVALQIDVEAKAAAPTP